MSDQIKYHPGFHVKIIVGKELPPREYAMFRVLTLNASREDLSAFNEMAFNITETAYKRYAGKCEV